MTCHVAEISSLCCNVVGYLESHTFSHGLTVAFFSKWAFEKSPPLRGVRGVSLGIVIKLKSKLKRAIIGNINLISIVALKNTPLTPLKGGIVECLDFSNTL